MVQRTSSSFRFLSIAGALILVAALLLRSVRLLWQPLWWDEGYSVYFATEPVVTMLQLTAQDIHPPLYYALLHGWLLLWGNASPLALRTFSLLVGVLAIPAIGWLARLIFPGRQLILIIATLLLTISPIHLFYSQEVRMYGLELLLGILSTGFFWQLTSGGQLRGSQNGRIRPALYYVLATTALLYSEYYAILLPLAHFLWALWAVRTSPLREKWDLLRPLIVADLIVALLYLPWLFYAIPYLIQYVAQKIVADADRPLGIFTYLWRYIWAFTGGHIAAAGSWLRWLQLVGTLSVALVLLVGLGGFAGRGVRRSFPAPFTFLVMLLLVCLGAGFLLNLRLPFFPEGGERVLLFVLPYFLLLLAATLDRLLRKKRPWMTASAGIGLVSLLATALVGVWTFYTVPRYSNDDYRSLIRQTVAFGNDDDTVFAVFPWQVGYWRAYTPIWRQGEQGGPKPVLSASPAWSEDIAAQLENALAHGKLWFPGHRSLGGILENQIETYLAGRALQFDDRWYTTTTRMSGWSKAPPSRIQAIGTEVDFGPIRLHGESGAGTEPVASANEVLPLSLEWSLDEPEALPLKITVRLLDKDGRIWAGRELQWDRGDSRFQAAGMSWGLLIPAGLPPQSYQLAVGVAPAKEGTLLMVDTADGPADVLPLATLQVVAPAARLSPSRLAIQQRLADPVLREGVAFLGFSGYDPEVPTLAGTEVDLSLFVQNQTTALPPLQLYVSLLDRNGDGVTGWEGWPLADYPTTRWTAGALARLPINFYIPADLEPGTYTLVAGIRNPSNGQKSTPIQLGKLPVTRRQVRLDAPVPQYPLSPPVQIGSHVLLLGYDLVDTDDTLQLTLYWEVLQTLLPPHQVFVHLTAVDGGILDQDDGVPGEGAIVAPSSTWLPGEIIVDPHELALPADLSSGAVIRVGLYIPKTGVRLPVIVDGQAAGDAIQLSILGTR